LENLRELPNPNDAFLGYMSINLTPTGGALPISYAWLPGGEITEDITNLKHGSYDVTVTDNSGCEFKTTYIVNEPLNLPIVTIDSNSFTKLINNRSISLPVNLISLFLADNIFSQTCISILNSGASSLRTSCFK